MVCIPLLPAVLACLFTGVANVIFVRPDDALPTWVHFVAALYWLFWMAKYTMIAVRRWRSANQ